MTASAEPRRVRPLAGSKSSTGSTMAARPPAWSYTTWVKVLVAGSKKDWTWGRWVGRVGLMGLPMTAAVSRVHIDAITLLANNLLVNIISTMKVTEPTTELTRPRPPKPDLAALQSSANQACALLKVLAHGDRLIILCRLAQGEFCVGELEEDLGIRQPTLSQQLGVLRQPGHAAPSPPPPSRHLNRQEPPHVRPQRWQHRPQPAHRRGRHPHRPGRDRSDRPLGLDRRRAPSDRHPALVPGLPALRPVDVQDPLSLPAC